MNWQFIDSGFNTGSYNMDFDVRLAKNYLPDESLLQTLQMEAILHILGSESKL